MWSNPHISLNFQFWLNLCIVDTKVPLLNSMTLLEIILTFKPDKTAIGTICFITYNRGNILLQTIKEILPTASKQWPILIVDNASIKYREEYKAIEKLAQSSKYLFYFRHDENLFAFGNILSLFDLAPTQFFIIVSDEDRPSIPVLDGLSPFLRENMDIGAIQTSLGTVPGVSRLMAHYWGDRIFEKGEGIRKFGLIGNYVTGVIYNGRLLKQLNIPQRLKKNLTANRFYPHLYLNILSAANTRVMYSSTIACLEGASEPYIVGDTSRHSPSDYFGTFSYGSRIDQFIALRNALFEAFQDVHKSNPKTTLDMTGFYDAYLHLCNKYQFIILKANGTLYKNELIDLRLLLNSFSLFCISSIESFPRFDRIRDSIVDNMLEMGKDHLEQKLQFDRS